MALSVTGFMMLGGGQFFLVSVHVLTARTSHWEQH